MSIPSGESAAEYVDPATLVPWKRNPRKNDGAVKAVAESIKEFGFGSPIVARKATRQIIAGHTRWKAATVLGLEKVPVRFLDISERQAERLALADNRLGELAEWDEELLRAFALEEPIDLAGLGFTDEEVERFMADSLEDVDLDGPQWKAPEEDQRVRFEVVVDAGAEAERVREMLKTIREEAPSAVVRLVR